MRYLRLIPHSLNPSSSYVKSSTHFRSKIKLFSTFSTPSYSSDLYQTPEPGIPTNPSWSHTRFARESTSVGEEKKLNPSENILGIVDEICGLNSIETMAVFEIVSKKLGIPESDIPIMFPMMPGMSLSGGKSSGKGGGAKAEEAKAEKTAFDLKLEKFDAAAKIKIIKEVRTFTDLGLKEAKDLVEKAPTLLKKGVAKEEAEKIIAKMKEIGAQVVME